MNDLSGRQFGGFLIGERLALGGMAGIYRARQLSTGREVAVKVLPAHRASEAELTARFEREARLLARLQHPHVLPLIDFGREEGMLYFVTPLLPHGDLGDRLARWGEALPLDEVRGILMQLCAALSAAHQAGIVHRDLKPANVLMDAQGNCLLSDFGIAKLLGDETLTAVGATLGTPQYMSPEQGSGGTVDARTDLYALGVIAFELATGRVPFDANSATETMLQHMEVAPPDPASLNPAIPPAFAALIRKALAKSPDDRFQSAEAFAAAVERALTARQSSALASTRQHEALPMQATTTVVQAIPVDPAQPKRPLGVIAAAALVVLAAVGVMAWGMLQDRALGPAADTGPATMADAPGRAADPSQLSAAPTTDAVSPSPSARSAPDTDRLAPELPSESPSSGAPASPPAFDDFEDRTRTAPDPARWTPVPGAVSTQVGLRDGVLSLVTRDQSKGVYAALSESADPRGHTVAARVRMPEAPLARQGSIGVTVSAYAPASTEAVWWGSCYLYGQAGTASAAPVCLDIAGASIPPGQPFAIGSWHDLELRVEPADGRLSASVDGRAFGTLPLPATMRGRALVWYVSLVGWSDDGRAVSGEFDRVDVR